MFCQSCGKQLSQGATFCNSCGTRVNNASPAYPAYGSVEAQTYQVQMQREATRKNEIASLCNAISYFSQKAALFKEYDNICQQLAMYARGARSALIIWGAIISTFGLIMIAATGGEEPDVAMTFAAISFIPGLLMILGGILMKVNNRNKLRRFQDEYMRVSDALYRHYMTCPACPVGPEFANPEILKFFLRVIESGRADTIKESINAALDDRRRIRIQRYIASVQRATAGIGPQLGAGAIFVSGAFFA